MKCDQSSAGPKKHPCPDCTFCQWCADSRCNICLRDQKTCAAAAPKNKAAIKKAKTVKKKTLKKTVKK
ncbi:MAG: hypothetical protein WCX65_08845 [bacterium]